MRNEGALGRGGPGGSDACVARLYALKGAFLSAELPSPTHVFKSAVRAQADSDMDCTRTRGCAATMCNHLKKTCLEALQNSETTAMLLCIRFCASPARRHLEAVVSCNIVVWHPLKYR
jgi:hypothetical protein